MGLRGFEGLGFRFRGLKGFRGLAGSGSGV